MLHAKAQRGFSLIELMIVVTVIGIIASIAIPNILATRRSANEASAQSSLRTVQSAEASYQATVGAGQFGTLVQLRTNGFIDTVLGNASAVATAKSGYIFAATPVAAANPPQFYATAMPANVTATPSRTGTRRFAIAEDGVIRTDSTIAVTPPDRAAVLAMPPTGN